jgi:hypothetical protein
LDPNYIPLWAKNTIKSNIDTFLKDYGTVRYAKKAAESFPEKVAKFCLFLEESFDISAEDAEDQTSADQTAKR